MPRRNSRQHTPYPTYQPYPVSRRSPHQTYAPSDRDEVPRTPPEPDEPNLFGDSPDLVGDAHVATWDSPRPTSPNDKRTFQPLRLLHSLFADRLDFLHAALRELQDAKYERRRLTAEALGDIDSHIRDCDRAISLLKDNKPLNDFERRKHLEHQLLELKRQRRQGAPGDRQDSGHTA